jgi:hypothetical protein
MDSRPTTPSNRHAESSVRFTAKVENITEKSIRTNDVLFDSQACKNGGTQKIQILAGTGVYSQITAML